MSTCIWKKKVGSEATVYDSRSAGQHSVHTSIKTKAKDYKCGDKISRMMRIDNDGNSENVIPDCNNQNLVRENGDFRRACCEITDNTNCKKDSLYQKDIEIAEEEAKQAKEQAKEEAKQAKKEAKQAKKGGSINLTKEQAKQLIKQMGGNSIKSTYVSYNGKDAKILGYNRNMRELIVQSNTGLENISVDNLLLNGKRVL